MKLIVGLGNPGKEYEKTRHNIGYNLIDYIVNKKGYGTFSQKFNADYLQADIEGEKVIIIKPLSYMNLSGIVVKKYIDYFKLTLDDILIIQDDLDMKVGKIKIVYNSSSGGHNGIKNIEENLSNHKDYVRLKIGISNNKSLDTKDYVLGKFSKSEKEILENSYKKLENVFEDFIKMSYSSLMNKYNNK